MRATTSGGYFPHINNMIVIINMVAMMYNISESILICYSKSTGNLMDLV